MTGNRECAPGTAICLFVKWSSRWGRTQERATGSAPRLRARQSRRRRWSTRAPARELRRQPDPSRVRGHPALDASGRGRGREPQPDHLRRQRDDTVARLRTRGRTERAEGARDAVFHEPVSAHRRRAVASPWPTTARRRASWARSCRQRSTGSRPPVCGQPSPRTIARSATSGKDTRWTRDQENRTAGGQADPKLDSTVKMVLVQGF